MTFLLLSFMDCVRKLTNLCDKDGDRERSVVGWGGVLESYLDCVWIGVRSGG